jgi:hypothetical protein
MSETLEHDPQKSRALWGWLLGALAPLSLGATLVFAQWVEQGYRAFGGDLTGWLVIAPFAMALGLPAPLIARKPFARYWPVAVGVAAVGSLLGVLTLRFLLAPSRL